MQTKDCPNCRGIMWLDRVQESAPSPYSVAIYGVAYVCENEDCEYQIEYDTLAPLVNLEGL